jgi:alpha-beta hydrolase superfamily lysophospholipase
MEKFFKVLIFSVFFTINIFAKNIDYDFYSFEKIDIETFDNSSINCLFRLSQAKNDPVFILIPDYKQKKETWNPLLKPLLQKDYSIATYDLRVFPEFERKNRKLQNNDYEYRRNYFQLDLNKLLVFLDLNYDIKDNQIVLIGLGLGANIALKYAVSNSNIKSVILLSPQKEYKRFPAKYHMRSYGNTRPIMILSSSKFNESYNTCLAYMAHLSRNQDVRFKFYDSDKQGMNFLKEPNVVKDIVEWINRYYK